MKYYVETTEFGQGFPAAAMMDQTTYDDRQELLSRITRIHLYLKKHHVGVCSNKKTLTLSIGGHNLIRAESQRTRNKRLREAEQRLKGESLNKPELGWNTVHKRLAAIDPITYD